MKGKHSQQRNYEKLRETERENESNAPKRMYADALPHLPHRFDNCRISGYIILTCNSNNIQFVYVCVPIIIIQRSIQLFPAP